MRQATVSLIALLATAAITASCASASTLATPRCSLQIIVVMSPPGTQRPAASVVASLARSAKVGLTFLRDAGTGSYVFRLQAQDGADACQRGLERLRTDPRILAADIDARRKAAGE